MEENLKIVDEAAEAICQVINAFEYFRKDNFPLNEFLKTIECTVARRSHQKYGETKKRKLNHVLVLDELSSSRDVNNSAIQVIIRNLEAHENLAALSLAKAEELEAGIQNEAEEISSQEQVFGNSLLLETILRNLTTSELKSCRYVNRTWNTGATTVLRHSVKITFSLFDPSKYIQESSESQIPHHQNSTRSPPSSSSARIIKHASDLGHLNELVRSSFQNALPFPCTYFIFNCGNLTNPDLQNFLSNHGVIIKHLHIDLNCDPECDQHEFLKLLRKLLVRDIPNVETLELGKFPVLWDHANDTSQLFPDPHLKVSHSKKEKVANLVPLSKLKSLHFHTLPPKKIFMDLLSIATKNSKIRSIGMGDGSGGWCEADAGLAPWLIEANRVDLLTVLEFSLNKKNLDVYSNLAGHGNLNLNKLIINIDDSEGDGNGDGDGTPSFKTSFARVISKFLKSSKDSLTEFHSPPLGYFDYDGEILQISPMTKLTKMAILNYEDGNGETHHQIFPKGLQLSKVFPALKSLQCQVFYDLEEYDLDYMGWDTCFGAGKEYAVQSLKDIRFSYGPPLPWIRHFSEMFPNITTLRIGFVNDFVEAAKVLWKIPNLTKLAFIVAVHFEENAFPAIDAGFTGFSKETCLELYEASRKVDSSNINRLRKNSSVLDAKCLRQLHMLLYDPSEDTRTGETFRCVSHVAGLFAFQMYPELDVTLSIGSNERNNERILKNGLSPILPYIQDSTVIKEPYDSNSLYWK